MSTGTFDPWQQVFTISMWTNSDSIWKEEHKSMAQLQADLSAAIQGKLITHQAQIGSSWKIVWGPCVYQKPGSGLADNAMLVAHNTASNMYVVAIAGTNFLSLFDWISEDDFVRPIMAWPYGQSMPPGTTFPAGVAIAPGMSAGVDVLRSMPGEDQPGPSLAAFLQSVRSTSATLVFAGHGLGGALAPTLACAMVTRGDLDLIQWENVYVYPTAGPTPGNGQLVTLFRRLFPQIAIGSRPWQIWNSLLWNSLDVVPHAWNEATLSQIVNLYAPTIPAGLLVKEPVEMARASARGQGYQQLQSNGALAGSIVPQRDSIDLFFSQALYQHIVAYFLLLGVQSVLPPKSAAALLAETTA